MLKAQGTISNVRTLGDGSIRLTVDTQELRPQDKATLMELHQTLGWFCFNPTGIQEQDVPDVTVEFEQKSPSQRLRNTLFVYFTKRGGKKEDFNLYYQRHLEGLIEKLKVKIQELDQIN